MVKGWDDSQYGPSFTARAVNFIERQHAKAPDKPFFLYLPSQAPHRPCVPPKVVAGKSKAGRRGDMVMEFDWTVGQILQTLDRLKLYDNTLVLVTSDNGGTPGDPFPPRTKKRNGNIFGETFGHKSCGELRGFKSQIWEGGHRVPLLARWPGHIQSGNVTNQLVCLTDVMATVVELIGDPPEKAGADSVSFLPTLLGSADGQRNASRAIIHHDYAGRFAIRQGEWKYVAAAAQLGRNADNLAQLFNLRDDPGEQNNLLALHPAIASRLARLLKEHRSEPPER